MLHFQSELCIYSLMSHVVQIGVSLPGGRTRFMYVGDPSRAEIQEDTLASMGYLTQHHNSFGFAR